MEYSTNCKIFRLFAKRRKLFTITLVIIFFAPGISAQNVSFDANLVSVNGYYCTALGYGVLYTNTIGSNNTGTGYNALFANTLAVTIRPRDTMHSSQIPGVIIIQPLDTMDYWPTPGEIIILQMGTMHSLLILPVMPTLLLAPLQA